MIVIFPMTGSLFFEGNDFHYPKPLIELHDKTLIEYAIDGFTDIPDVEFRFVIKQDDDRRFKLSSIIHQATKGLPVQIFTVPDKTSGALCSALIALPDEDGAENQEVIISNYDQIFTTELFSLVSRFYNSDADFGLVSFDSIHPKWSYVRLDSEGIVCEASEKNPISRHALCGFYYFRDKATLTAAILNVLRAASPNQEVFYVSEVLNQLVLMGKKGEIETIFRDNYVNFYEPNIVHEYLSQTGNKKYSVTKLTQSYVSAFHRRDIDAILEHFSEDAVLTDPSVELSSREKISEFLKSFFHSNQETRFTAKSIHASEESSVIHFELAIGEKLYHGTDVIQWADKKIVKLQAYLTEVAYE